MAPKQRETIEGNGRVGNGKVGNGKVGNGKVGNGRVGNGRVVIEMKGENEMRMAVKGKKGDYKERKKGYYKEIKNRTRIENNVIRISNHE